MKTSLKPRASTRPSPEQALAATAEAAPRQPAAIAPGKPDVALTLNVRFRASSITALAAEAKKRGQTQKQVIAHALKAAGVPVADADLEDRTPRRTL